MTVYAFLLPVLITLSSNTRGVVAVDIRDVKISILDDPLSVWNSVDTWNACHIIDVPDIPARAFATPEGVQMICGAIGYHHMQGPTLFNMSRSCPIAWNATGNATPSMFAANEFLDSTIRFDNGTVVSLVHTEYPGNRYDNCDGPAYPYCWTVTVGLAVSYDWGNTWQHARPPPHHLVAAVPYPYNQSQLAYGWGDPSNIVRHPSDGYYYVALWNRNQVGLQPPGVCIARTNHLLDPQSWRAWNGSAFAVRFVDPYRGVTDPKDHICQVVNLPAPNDCTIFGLVWSVYLQRFVATLGCFGSLGRSFYFAISPDLIHWSNTKEFYSRSNDLPPQVSDMTTSFSYPNFLDPVALSKHNDPNFYTIGQRPYLFWTSLGHSPYTDGRHLWATPMEFSIVQEEEGMKETGYRNDLLEPQDTQRERALSHFLLG